MEINRPDLMGLQAEVVGLKRRVAALEAQHMGSVKRYRSWPLLQALYVQAITGRVEPSESTAVTWAASVSLLDEEMLLEMGRAAGDPFPWRCFLLLLDRFTFYGFDVEQPTQHLLELARNLLRIQGLGKVPPEEILRAELTPVPSYQIGR